MRVVALVLVAACSSPQNCPTAAQLGGRDELERTEAKIIAERCRADGWSKQVTDCLSHASNMAAREECLRSLTPQQKTSLDRTASMLEGELTDAEKAATLAQLDRDIAAMRLDELVEQAPGCSDYRAAILEAKAALTKCPRLNALEAFGFGQAGLAMVKEMRKTTDPAQLAADCASAASGVRYKPPACD